MPRTIRLALAALVSVCGALSISSPAQDAASSITITANGPTRSFPHFWEQMFGSGRAILALRANYLNDLEEVHDAIGMRYVRFHAIFHDEVGVYDENQNGDPVFNFTYVDQIYDGLLARGVRPFVEISFMPYKLASKPAIHPFWYKQNVAPPKDYAKWDALIHAFAQHLVDRYGIDEVAQWYFEVWNEPNIDFWDGIPRQQSYFDLYAHTARTLKSVSPRLRVGGPATAAAAWIPEFLKFTSENHVPVDFVSTHAYADDTVENLFGTSEPIPMDDRVCRAVAKMKDQIKSSATPDLPLFLTEWNVQGMMQARDTIFMGPALANTVRQCDGMVNMMSFWTFSDVFEENGPLAKPFVGMFGLRAKGGINKPDYYAYGLLHQLGNQRMANAANDVIVTRDAQGGLVIAAWNLADPGQRGSTATVDLNFAHLSANAHASIERVDSDHGNVLKQYAAMGSPLDPTPAQVDELNRETALPPPEETHLTRNQLELTLTPNTLALIKVQP
jgi:xylan 1,4-beta-xylosidase